MKKIDHGDLIKILNQAMNNILDQPRAVFVSGELVNGDSEVRGSFREANVAVIDATIAFLQQRNLLTEPVSIDYRQKTVEPIDD